MADENLARADTQDTTDGAHGAEASQATGTGAVHSNDTTGNDDFAARVAKVTNPEELQRLTNEFLAGGETPPAQTGEAVTEESSGQAPGEEAGEKAGEDTKADVAGKVEEEAKADGKKDEGEDDEGETGVARLRLRKQKADKAGLRALELQNRNPDLSLEECLQRARTELGLDTRPKEGADAAKTKPEDKPEADGPATVEDADKLLKDLRARKRTAMLKDFDFEAATDLDEQIDALVDRRAALVVEAAKIEGAAASEYDTKFDAAQTKAASLYDFVRDADGAESKRMLEIDAALKASGDPLYSDPEKPLILAQMVAREFRVAPKAPASSTKPATQAAGVKPAPSKAKPVAPIASGQSRTANTASNQAGQHILDRAGRIKSPAEMEDFLASLRP